MKRNKNSSKISCLTIILVIIYLLSNLNRTNFRSCVEDAFHLSMWLIKKKTLIHKINIMEMKCLSFYVEDLHWCVNNSFSDLGKFFFYIVITIFSNQNNNRRIKKKV